MHTASHHTATLEVSVPSGVGVHFNPSNRRLRLGATSLVSPEQAEKLLAQLVERIMDELHAAGMPTR